MDKFKFFGGFKRKKEVENSEPLQRQNAWEDLEEETNSHELIASPEYHANNEELKRVKERIADVVGGPKA